MGLKYNKIAMPITRDTKTRVVGTIPPGNIVCTGFRQSRAPPILPHEVVGGSPKRSNDGVSAEGGGSIDCGGARLSSPKP
uniref:Uncharacterized protein n=1 Tax=Oryza sativa subsp. japonica TaxID=39947 RepID=Q6ETW0_ORYSJ|nr:hypothetical protein [Oryza sativa Japonica Group]